MASPDGSGAGPDACVAGAKRKTDKYSSVLNELVAEGYQYRPLVWSCWGRSGTDASAAMWAMASAAARRQGLADARPLARRAQALIGARLWRRVGAMVSTCLGRVDQCVLEQLLPGVDCSSDDDAEFGSEAEGPLPADAAASDIC